MKTADLIASITKELSKQRLEERTQVMGFLELGTIDDDLYPEGRRALMVRRSEDFVFLQRESFLAFSDTFLGYAFVRVNLVFGDARTREPVAKVFAVMHVPDSEIIDSGYELQVQGWSLDQLEAPNDNFWKPAIAWDDTRLERAVESLVQRFPEVPRVRIGTRGFQALLEGMGWEPRLQRNNLALETGKLTQCLYLTREDGLELGEIHVPLVADEPCDFRPNHNALFWWRHDQQEMGKPVSEAFDDFLDAEIPRVARRYLGGSNTHTRFILEHMATHPHTDHVERLVRGLTRHESYANVHPWTRALEANFSRRLLPSIMGHLERKALEPEEYDLQVELLGLLLEKKCFAQLDLLRSEHPDEALRDHLATLLSTQRR